MFLEKLLSRPEETDCFDGYVTTLRARMSFGAPERELVRFLFFADGVRRRRRRKEEMAIF